MGPTKPPPSLPSPGEHTSSPPSTTSTSTPTKPYPLLSLPKEIRQQIYSHLRPVTRYHIIPLHSDPHHLALVTTTIPGVFLLATNHQIHTEASYILSPHLDTIVKAPPKIILHANNLPGLVNLHDSFTHSRPFTARYIRHYRLGTLSSSSLAKKLNLPALNSSTNPRVLEAVTTFILRILTYLPTTSPSPTLHKYPPLGILIDIPTSPAFTSTSVTTTTSLARSIAYKIFFPRHPTPPRSRPGFTNLPWLLQRMVYHACWASDSSAAVCLSIHVRFLGSEGYVLEGWAGGWSVRESVVHKSVIKGVKSARRRGEGFVYYGGLAGGDVV
ncbi:hypothetical protein BKA58DRAFT_320042 [Alternaria rosae]|uniref:uncharacterized protein n=1 Tax=Alternaria rosae TaxID=1187941 RepID=UPI001E8D9E50|nr:uncharacterized protein BKA58DRAFT_320042 [Alternaria rosae]KAH6866311.1 hypothetical protein BKA58DRAFT_320042 [Alternaria rosae]